MSSDHGRRRDFRAVPDSVVDQRNCPSDVRIAWITSSKDFGMSGASFCPRVETVAFVPPSTSSGSRAMWAIRMKLHLRSEVSFFTIARTAFCPPCHSGQERISFAPQTSSIAMSERPVKPSTASTRDSSHSSAAPKSFPHRSHLKSDRTRRTSMNCWYSCLFGAFIFEYWSAVYVEASSAFSIRLSHEV